MGQSFHHFFPDEDGKQLCAHCAAQVEYDRQGKQWIIKVPVSENILDVVLEFMDEMDRRAETAGY